MAKFIVGIIHTSLSHFAVEADDAERARELALLAFSNDSPEVILGNEYDEVERMFVNTIEPTVSDIRETEGS